MGCSFNNIPEYREAQIERKNDLLTQENAKLRRLVQPPHQGRCVMEKLDQAWEEINVLGGSDIYANEHDAGIVKTVERALDIIEKLGGMDPKQRAPATSLERSGGAT